MVLEGFEPDPVSFFAIHPVSHAMSRKVAVFVESLASAFKNSDWRAVFATARPTHKADRRPAAKLATKIYSKSRVPPRDSRIGGRSVAGGRTYGDIAVEIGVGRRTIAKWVKLDEVLDRQRCVFQSRSPLYFQGFLARRLAEGDRVGRRIFHDVRNRDTSTDCRIWSDYYRLSAAVMVSELDPRCRRLRQRRWRAHRKAGH
jgi:hypothetical protein